MSRLYINDLERIKNGKVVRFSLGIYNNKSLVSLSRINNERIEFRNIRNSVIEEFKKDVNTEFDILKGQRIERNTNILLNPTKLFNHDYLELIVPTILGDTHCLFSNENLVSATSRTTDLDNKIKVIMPYVKRLFELKNKSNILDNDFYTEINVFNEDKRALILSGAGIFLPFTDYTELNEYELQDLLTYYYSNWNEILRNILVYNDEVLNLYRLDINKEKALKIYKGK